MYWIGNVIKCDVWTRTKDYGCLLLLGGRVGERGGGGGKAEAWIRYIYENKASVTYLCIVRVFVRFVSMYVDMYQ